MHVLVHNSMMCILKPMNRTMHGPALASTARLDIRVPVHLLPVGLLAVPVALAVIYLGTQKIERDQPGALSASVLRFFDMNAEANLPAWFSGALWQIGALLAYATWTAHRSRSLPNAGYWAGMVPLFLLMSLDEVGMIHESFGNVVKPMDGFFSYSWVVVGIVLVAVVGVSYARFLSRLKPLPMALFVLSAALFLGGALVIEMIGAAVASGALEWFPFGQSWTRMIAYEETLEMLGPIVLIHAILRILAAKEMPYRSSAADRGVTSGGAEIGAPVAEPRRAVNDRLAGAASRAQLRSSIPIRDGS